MRPEPNATSGSIFVFGSNLAGRHGKGAARDAVMHHGARFGRSLGLMGRSYGIPTKDEKLRTLSLRQIAVYVSTFISFANRNPQMDFMVTQIGCGYAGYSPEDIAPFFKRVPDNVYLPAAFLLHLYGKVDQSRVSFDR